MMPSLTHFLFGIAALSLFANGTVFAREINIAVASNFIKPLREISKLFEQRSGHKVNISAGSTGKHYTQIVHGAPFDLFFAADSKRPARLEENGLIVPGSRFTYAIGTLVLWSSKPDYVDNEGVILHRGGFQHLAIANPRLAPYGKAAREVMEAKGVWERLSSQTVRGENIGQTFQFVKSGNAELGFIAWSQIQKSGGEVSGSYWMIPSRLHSPIRQQAVQISASAIARDFLAFTQSPEVKAIIRQFGYNTP